MTLADISFECGTCGQRLVVDVAGAGTTVSCPMCEHEITVPHENGDSVAAALLDLHPGVPASSADQRELPAGPTDLRPFRVEGGRNAAALAQTGAELKLLLKEQSAWQESRRRLEAARAQAEQNLALALVERAELAKAVGESGAHIAELEALLSEYRQSHEAASQIESAHSHATDELRRAHQECATLREAMEATRRRFTDFQAQLAEREKEVHERDATIHGLVNRKREAEAALQQLDARRAQAEEQLQQALAEKAELLDSLDLSRRHVAALETQLEARERACEERGASIESLRAELSENEARLVEVQSELAAAQATMEELPGLRAACAALQERFATLAAEQEALARALAEREAEIAALQGGLAESQAGREVLGVHQRAQKAEQERDAANRLRLEAEKEAAKAHAETARWREDCEEMARRHREAEARAEAGAVGPEEQSTRMLRGILERQAAELAERCRELSLLRKERFALRLAYAGVGFLVLGIVALALKVVQNFS